MRGSLLALAVIALAACSDPTAPPEAKAPAPVAVAAPVAATLPPPQITTQRTVDCFFKGQVISGPWPNCDWVKEYYNNARTAVAPSLTPVGSFLTGNEAPAPVCVPWMEYSGYDEYGNLVPFAWHTCWRIVLIGHRQAASPTTLLTPPR